MSKWAAFGASVTQQENGYANQLSKLIGNRIKKFGYGGMHLSDAGMCFIDTVLKYKPNYVFIDWFSTDYMEQSIKTEQYIDTILYKFSCINCAVIFLILPEVRSDCRQAEKDSFYDFCRNQLNKRNAYFIDLAKEIPTNDLSNYLRDDIHTTVYGAKKYAELIKKHLQAVPPYLLNNENYISNAYYKNINWLKVNRVFEKNIDLYMDCEILGFYCTIGRHSGLCEINFDNEDKQERLLWDKWCHYERKHFSFPITQYKGFVELKILQKEIDTSSCSVLIPFGKYKKNIACHSICWIGNELKINNKKCGSKIKIFNLELIRILKEYKHFVGKIVKRTLLWR